ncbi:TPA: McrC family protein [Vibrio parahaemolyticus]
MIETIVVKEYEEVTLPSSIMEDGSKVNAFNEALEKNYFSIRLKKGELVFQAGGYVGVISVNEKLSLDIRPKVPLSNLERILLISKSVPKAFSKGTIKYSKSNYVPEAIEDFLWMEVLNEAENLHALGLIKKYKKVSEYTSYPSGKIDTFKSSIKSKISGKPIAYSTRFERDIDTPENQLVKMLILALKGRNKEYRDSNIKRRISICLSHFDSVTTDYRYNFFSSPSIKNPETLPSTKDHYRRIIEISKLIFDSKGLGFFDTQNQSVECSSLLISMEDAFEKYILTILKKGSDKFNQINVKDGNKDGEDGAKKNLFDTTSHPKQYPKKIKATPDILIEHLGEGGQVKNIVIDVKYKEKKDIASRADINQVMSYAASYNSKHAVIILPSEGNKKGIECLGSFSGIGFFQYFIDLSTTNFDEEESIFIDEILSLFKVDIS